MRRSVSGLGPSGAPLGGLEPRSALQLVWQTDPVIGTGRNVPKSALIDISRPLAPEMAVWPGSVGMRLESVARIAAGAEANVSTLICDVHAGTHVDAPWHHLEDGATAEQLQLEALIGPARVVDTGSALTLDGRELARSGIPERTQRVLFRTRNSEILAADERNFREDYVALAASGAEWLVQAGVRLVGIDALSVQRYGDPARTHRILLEAGVVLLEGLDLTGVAGGEYELICLPLRLVGAEGAPARAILRRSGP